jgi:hypothetical protein
VKAKRSRLLSERSPEHSLKKGGENLWHHYAKLKAESIQRKKQAKLQRQCKWFLLPTGTAGL